ncbi:hypothetical protein, partial [Schnuerera sp.]|uniref:hypothetical protein n=1 Tax=Schnuerera sp. TaxID=2794844 RepID=UPI002BE05F8A
MVLARYKGSFVVNIDPEEVRKVVPKPFRGVDIFLESVSLDSLDNAIYSLKLDDAKKLDERLQYVCSAFKEATGMFLGYSHHEVESV